MTTQNAPKSAEDLSDDVRLGDEAFFAERFGEAQQHYQRAVDAGSDVAGLAERLERARVNAMTDVGRGEHQAQVFAKQFERTSRDGAFQDPPDIGVPPPGPQPEPDRLRVVKVQGG